MHLHIDDIIRLLPVWKAEAIVLVHVSRRTTIHYARERIEKLAGADAARIHLLMDHRTNRARYEAQVAAAQDSADKSEAAKAAKAARTDDAGAAAERSDGAADESQGQTPATAE